MKEDPALEVERIAQSLALARAEKPAYSNLYPFLESLLTIRAEVKGTIALDPLDISPEGVRTRWDAGFPLLNRWDFPIDIQAAEAVLRHMEEHLPAENTQLREACSLLSSSLAEHGGERETIWKSFLYHEMEPWEEWIDTARTDAASLLFAARSCLRPSIEWTADDLLARFPLPQSWHKGYCPICGSLPSLLYLAGLGENRGYCSWCGAQWGMNRLQCPYCDNRYHESLGYIRVETEPHYRVNYCNLCKYYFKQIDTREFLYPPCFPLEEWTTLHLDLLAQRSGFRQAPSPSPTAYGNDLS